MKIYYTLQAVIIIFLAVMSLISFWTHNVADAIYFLVVANFLILAVLMGVVRRIRD